MRPAKMLPLLALASTSLFAVPTSRPGWFLCDAVNAPVAVLVGLPLQGHSLITLVSRGTGATVTRRLAVGPAEAGMNQLHYPLTLAGRAVGDLHLVQPAVLDRPATARTPTFTSVTMDGRTMACRWSADMLFMGMNARRSFLVTQDGGRIVYRSFDAARHAPVTESAGIGRSNVATLTIGGGVRSRTGSVTRFRFNNRGYRYDVLVPDGGVARVAVARGGRVIQTETLLGYTLAPS
jgi:hypothetical protein